MPIPEPMTVWVWIGVGVAAFLALSIAASFAIARVLGAISSDINEILEREGWMSAPLTRATELPENAPAQPKALGQTGATRLRGPRG